MNQNLIIMRLSNFFSFLLLLAFTLALPNTSFAQIVREPTVSSPDAGNNEDTTADEEVPVRTRRTQRTTTSSNRQTERPERDRRRDTANRPNRGSNNPCAPGWGRSNNQGNNQRATTTRTQRQVRTRVYRGGNNQAANRRVRTNRRGAVNFNRQAATFGRPQTNIPLNGVRSRVTVTTTTRKLKVGN